jgi:hypothetical protein
MRLCLVSRTVLSVGCMNVFLFGSNLKFLVQLRVRCGPVMEGAVNGLMLVMVFLFSGTCCDGISLK